MGPYTAAAMTPAAIDMLDFWQRQKDWSYETFGPPERRGPIGPLRHLEKEAKEAYSEADEAKRREEIADCLFLVFDAAHRSGMSYPDLARECMAKLRKNQGRTWPDWRKQPTDQPTEHDRTGEAIDDFTVVGQIKTFTGRYVQPLAMKPEDLVIDDIAHGLSRICRFNGHCQGYLTVASHSIRVMHRLNTRDRRVLRSSLLHDAAEAYIGDLPRPLKRHPAFAFYVDAEDRICRALAERFDLIYPWPQEVKEADEAELREDINERRTWNEFEDPRRVERWFLNEWKAVEGTH